jgi:hypothetical protein
MSKIGKLRQRVADIANPKEWEFKPSYPKTGNDADDILEMFKKEPEKWKLQETIADELQAVKDKKVAPSNVYSDPPSNERWDEPISDQDEDYETIPEQYDRLTKTLTKDEIDVGGRTKKFIRSVNVQPMRARDRQKVMYESNIKQYAKLKQRIAQVRLAIDYSMESWKSYGPDMDAVKAFMNKRKYFGRKGVVDRKTGTKKGDYKFRTDGRTLFVWDSPVVKHSKDGGFDVSGAKYNTPLTMSTINAVGIHAREGRYDPEGRNRISLGSEFLESNDPTWVHISPDEVQSKPVIYEDRVGGGKKRGTSGVSGVRRPNQAEFSSATIARERVESGIKKGNPPSKTNIQPTDQENINKITGLNTKIPRDTLGVKAHHYLDYADKGKDLPKEHGGIMLPDDYHDFITRFQKGSPKGNQRRLRQVSSKLRLKIARIRQRNISRRVTQINMAKEDYDPDNAWFEIDRELDRLENTPGSEGNWTYHKGKLVNFEHEKDTLDLLDSVEGDPKHSMFSVSNTHDITNRKDAQLKTKFNEFVKQGYKPTVGRWEGKFDATVNFRDKDRKQVEKIARGELDAFGKPLKNDKGKTLAQQSYVETTEIPRKAPTGPRKYKTKFFNYNEETDTYEE